jgi:hypothetical protein
MTKIDSGSVRRMPARRESILVKMIKLSEFCIDEHEKQTILGVLKRQIH